MEKINKRLAVIFDMDGVIIDSNPLIVISWKTFFEKHHMVLNDEQLNHYIFGRTAQETVSMVFPTGLAPELINRFSDEVAADVRRRYASEGQIVAGFTEFVKYLAAHGIAMAIATSAPTKNVNVVLELAGVSPYISRITDASEVSHSKPHPEVYLKTAAKLGVPPSDCCVFEDSFSGIRSAKDAGMIVIGVATTHSAKELAPITDAVIADFDHLKINDMEAIIEKRRLRHQ